MCFTGIQYSVFVQNKLVIYTCVFKLIDKRTLLKLVIALDIHKTCEKIQLELRSQHDNNLCQSNVCVY